MYRERLHQVGGLCGQALLLLDVVSHIAELLLQHTHSLKVGRVVEGVTAEKQELMAGRFVKSGIRKIVFLSFFFDACLPTDANLCCVFSICLIFFLHNIQTERLPRLTLMR